MQANPTDLQRETTDEREARITESIQVIEQVSAEATCADQPKPCRRIWPGPRTKLALAMYAIAYHESKFAHYVGSGHCEDGPRSARCDNGQARTYWQMHPQTCPEAWAAEPGSHAELEAAARCTVRVFAASARICSAPGTKWWAEGMPSWSLIFAKYGGQECSWPGGAAREITMISIEQKLGAAKVDP